MYKAAGLLALIMVMSLFSSSMAEAKPSSLQPNLKYMKEIQNPTDGKSVKITKITKSKFLPILHIVSIETCAGKDKLYSPELSLKSDLESIIVKISGLIVSKTCRNNDFFIRANNSDSISVSFSNTNLNLQIIPH